MGQFKRASVLGERHPKMRTVPTFHGGLVGDVRCRRFNDYGLHDCTEAACVALMHRRDQARQAWIIPGVVKQVANNRPKERGGEHHAIVRLFQLRRQIDRQRLRPQSIQRFRIGIGEVRERHSAARGVRASPEK